MSLQVLKDAGADGMSLGDIMHVSASRGLKDWEPGAKRILQFVSPAPLAAHMHCTFQICLLELKLVCAAMPVPA